MRAHTCPASIEHMLLHGSSHWEAQPRQSLHLPPATAGRTAHRMRHWTLGVKDQGIGCPCGQAAPALLQEAARPQPSVHAGASAKDGSEAFPPPEGPGAAEQATELLGASGAPAPAGTAQGAPAAPGADERALASAAAQQSAHPAAAGAGSEAISGTGAAPGPAHGRAVQWLGRFTWVDLQACMLLTRPVLPLPSMQEPCGMPAALVCCLCSWAAVVRAWPGLLPWAPSLYYHQPAACGTHTPSGAERVQGRTTQLHMAWMLQRMCQALQMQTAGPCR